MCAMHPIIYGVAPIKLDTWRWMSELSLGVARRAHRGVVVDASATGRQARSAPISSASPRPPSANALSRGRGPLQVRIGAGQREKNVRAQ